MVSRPTMAHAGGSGAGPTSSDYEQKWDKYAKDTYADFASRCPGSSKDSTLPHETGQVSILCYLPV